MYNTFGNKWKTRLNSFLLIINKAGQEEDVDIKQENFFFLFPVPCLFFVCLFVWLCDDDEDGIEGGEEGEGAREKCTAARDGTDQNSTAQRSKF